MTTGATDESSVEGIEELLDGTRTVLTVEETARVLNLGRTATYDAIRRRQLPALRIGRRLLVPVPYLKRLLNGEAGLRGGPGTES